MWTFVKKRSKNHGIMEKIGVHREIQHLITLLCIDAQTCNIPSQHIYVFLSLWVFNLSSDVYNYGYNYIYPQDSFTIHGNKECSEKAKMKNRINWTGMFCNISENT